MLRCHENVCQQSVNNFWSCTLGNQVIVQTLEFTTELLTNCNGKTTKYWTKNTDSKTIEIANCKTCKTRLWDVELACLITYYHQTTKSRALSESTDGPTGWPSDNLLNSDGLGGFHWSVLKLTAQVYWRPGQPIWQCFGFEPDPNLKRWSGTGTKLPILQQNKVNHISFRHTNSFIRIASMYVNTNVATLTKFSAAGRLYII